MAKKNPANGAAKTNGAVKRRSGPSQQKILTPRSFGPIIDLEHHLPSDWWRNLFNSLYLKTDGDVVENVDNTVAEMDMVIKIGNLKPGDRILDLCCGQGRHALELAQRGFINMVGIDRSRFLVRLARKRAKELNYSIMFHEGDARRYRRFDYPFGCVMIMGNSFGYFDRETDDKAVMDNVFRLLESDGTILMDVADGEWLRANFEARSWEWIDKNQFVCRERSLASDGQRLISREVITHAERGVIADQFYAERLYSREEMRKLLEASGFINIAFHDYGETLSTRGHDLGMMAHRLFVSANKPVRTVTVSLDKVTIPKVMVIMGDPSLPDKVKRGGHFNKEDLDTVQKLKNALGELKEYEFTYWNDHQNLLPLLASKPPQFVFNLCDEGYRNDSFMEPHVAAVLDMMQIPYSGASPSCLALCYNKNMVNSIAQSLDVPVPMETYIEGDESGATLPSVFPAMLKPNCGDSSMGITKDAVVQNGNELLIYLDWLRKTYGPVSVLIQEFLSGPEYSVGIIGNPRLSYRVLPLLEVDYSRLEPGLTPILSYESKWVPDSPWWKQISYKRAELEEDRLRKLVDYSNVLFERLGCRDYARFDFRCDGDGNIKLLEVNPNPGWCWDGKLNMMATFAGMSYSELLRSVISAAQERITVSMK
ncbi:MAG: methyltransferase domain-containing protein [Candidatus Schekmanbacteria bacterium]|nr:methyltransferase domain-containing protein [Candidatus Schekmanbacteria bacterium]